MKAQRIHSFGTADLLQLEEIAQPPVGAQQVLIKVAATSVNVADVKARELGHVLDFVPDLPASLGMDFAGTVEAIGAGVQRFKPGDEVYGCAGGVKGHGGAMAEFIAADARFVALKPTALSMVEAAALPLVSITAWEALFDRMQIKAGDHVLIHGGAGGVGHIAVQLALSRGARVAATHHGDRQSAAIAELGATPIDYELESPEDFVRRLTGGQGFDAVFDTVGGENIARSLRAAKLNGQVATTVSLVEVDLTVAHLKGLSLHVIYMLIPMLHGVGGDRHQQILTELAALVDAGKVRPRIEATYSLADAPMAHRRLERGDLVGKVVIEVG